MEFFNNFNERIKKLIYKEKCMYLNCVYDVDIRYIIIILSCFDDHYKDQDVTIVDSDENDYKKNFLQLLTTFNKCFPKCFHLINDKKCLNDIYLNNNINSLKNKISDHLTKLYNFNDILKLKNDNLLHVINNSNSLLYVLMKLKLVSPIEYYKEYYNYEYNEKIKIFKFELNFKLPSVLFKKISSVSSVLFEQITYNNNYNSPDTQIRYNNKQLNESDFEFRGNTIMKLKDLNYGIKIPDRNFTLATNIDYIDNYINNNDDFIINVDDNTNDLTNDEYDGIEIIEEPEEPENGDDEDTIPFSPPEPVPTTSLLGKRRNVLSIDDFRNIEIENDGLKCQICYNTSVKIIPKPCNHAQCCISCYNILLEQLNNDFSKLKCPICQTGVENLEKIFISSI